MSKKSKYSIEFKIRLVKEVLSGKYSVRGLSKQYSLPRFLLRKWVDQYQFLGTKGLLPRESQNYTSGFKLKVIETYHRKKLTLRDCCLQYDIPSQSTLISWLRKYAQLGKDGICKGRGRPPLIKRDMPPKKSSKPLTRLEELEKENLYLRAENDYLKKLEALTQKKITSQKKKR